MKKNLENIGDMLAHKSDVLIDKANQVLASPREPAVKKAFLDEVRASRELTHQLVDPLKLDESRPHAWVDDDEVVEASDQLMTVLPKIVDVTQQYGNSPNDQVAMDNLKALMENVKVETRTIAATAVPTPEIVELKDRINTLIAKISPVVGGPTDLDSLLGSASTLAGSLTQLIAHARATMQKNEYLSYAIVLDIIGSSIGDSIAIL
jgi:hypothetical protein